MRVCHAVFSCTPPPTPQHFVTPEPASKSADRAQRSATGTPNPAKDTSAPPVNAALMALPRPSRQHLDRHRTDRRRHRPRPPLPEPARPLRPARRHHLRRHRTRFPCRGGPFARQHLGRSRLRTRPLRPRTGSPPTIVLASAIAFTDTYLPFAKNRSSPAPTHPRPPISSSDPI